MNDYLEALRDDGVALAEAAGKGLDPPVPACEGWTVADLVLHIGMVHRHKLEIVRGRLAGPPDPWPPPAPARRAARLVLRRAGGAADRAGGHRPRDPGVDLPPARPDGRLLVPAHGPGDGRAPGRRPERLRRPRPGAGGAGRRRGGRAAGGVPGPAHRGLARRRAWGVAAPARHRHRGRVAAAAAAGRGRGRPGPRPGRRRRRRRRLRPAAVPLGRAGADPLERSGDPAVLARVRELAAAATQ